MRRKADIRASLTIVIVDDDEGHAILIHKGLEESGLVHGIEHLRNGQAALDFFLDRARRDLTGSGGPCLVLLDIQMPKIDGIEVLRRMKLAPHTRSLPIIMLTTSDDPWTVERCYALGCNGYVRKPIGCDRFSDAVQSIGRFATLLRIPEIPRHRPIGTLSRFGRGASPNPPT